MTDLVKDLEDGGTHVGENCYGVVLTPEGEIVVIAPSRKQDDPLTDGHLLTMGIAMRLADTEFVQEMIQHSVSEIQDAQQKAQDASGGMEKVD